MGDIMVQSEPIRNRIGKQKGRICKGRTNGRKDKADSEDRAWGNE
jgi:hypothetical protein